MEDRIFSGIAIECVYSESLGRIHNRARYPNTYLLMKAINWVCRNLLK